MEPKVLLLDEPLSAIDAQLRKNLQAEIRRIQKKLEITTLFVTHDQDEAMVMSDTIHLFNVGRIEQSGTPVEVYTRPKTKFAASFIGSYNIVSAEAFNALAGTGFDCSDVGIRPEVITIAHTNVAASAAAKAAALQLSGVVTASAPHGSIIRYTVDCGGGKALLNADTLFDSGTLFAVGDRVSLGVAPEQVLPLI